LQATGGICYLIDMYYVIFISLTIIIVGLAILFFFTPKFQLIERKSKRYPVRDTNIKIRTTIFGQEKETTVRITNISIGGLGFISDIDMAIDSRFSFECNGKKIQGIIRFKLPLEQTPTPFFQYGAEYIDSPTQECEAFLKNILAQGKTEFKDKLQHSR